MRWWSMFWKWRRERSPERKKRDVWVAAVPAVLVAMGPPVATPAVIDAWNESGPLEATGVLLVVLLVVGSLSCR